MPAPELYVSDIDIFSEDGAMILLSYSSLHQLVLCVMSLDYQGSFGFLFVHLL